MGGRLAVEGNEILTDASGSVLADATIASGDKFPFFDASDNDDPKLADPNDLVPLLSHKTLWHSRRRMPMQRLKNSNVLHQNRKNLANRSVRIPILQREWPRLKLILMP